MSKLMSIVEDWAKGGINLGKYTLEKRLWFDCRAFEPIAKTPLKNCHARLPAR